MAEAAERFLIGDDEHNDKKAHDPDSWTRQARASKRQDSEDSELSRSLPPGDNFHSEGGTKHNAPLNVTPPELGNESLNAGVVVPLLKYDDSAPARAYWEATDILGTQSYGRSGKACAMCAQHVL
jgi:hypothetical protein